MAWYYLDLWHWNPPFGWQRIADQGPDLRSEFRGATDWLTWVEDWTHVYGNAPGDYLARRFRYDSGNWTVIASQWI